MEIIVLAQNGHRHAVTLTPTSTIAALKQSLFDAWPTELGPAPAKSSFIRVIHAGKILTDAATFESMTPSAPVDATSGSSAVVHISVRPASVETVGKDGAAGKLAKTGCGCCLIS